MDVLRGPRHLSSMPLLLKTLTLSLLLHQAASISGWAYEEGSPVDVLRRPRHLARIALRGPHHVLAAAASPDGALVAVSDASCVRLFRVRLRTVFGV